MFVSGKLNDIGSKLIQNLVASGERQMPKKSLSQKDLRSYDGSVSVIAVWILLLNIFVSLKICTCSNKIRNI
jgi:hypothetical protein